MRKSSRFLPSYPRFESHHSQRFSDELLVLLGKVMGPKMGPNNIPGSLQLVCGGYGRRWRSNEGVFGWTTLPYKYQLVYRLDEEKGFYRLQGIWI